MKKIPYFLSSSTTKLEYPQRGWCGVPFIKSTTLLSLTHLEMINCAFSFVIYTVVGFSPSVENLKASWAPMRPVRIVRVKKLVSIFKIIIICGIGRKKGKRFH